MVNEWAFSILALESLVVGVATKFKSIKHIKQRGEQPTLC
jgi:hypothetical protein